MGKNKLDTIPNKRLAILMKVLDLSSIELAEILGTTRQNVNKAYKEDDLRPSFLKVLKERFPKLSSEWLLTGNGPVIEEEMIPVSELKNLVDGDNRKLLEKVEKLQSENERLNRIIDLMVQSAKEN